MVLINPEKPASRKQLGCFAAALLFPFAILVKLVTMPFERPVELSASQVAQYLRDFIEGTGGDWDFDDFVSIPIGDPRLNTIRERAIAVDLPITEEGLAKLRALLAEAEALAATDVVDGAGTRQDLSR